ncbi:GCN5-related N-acetyltransferase [Kribbella flavida DSM 17836]|uniref:GCN5-related N-acetyltransferase n=1 Tax=Kribbella flavida (strain DSM 17836 / JCM 10339 / NBRC 14399) TaxID=479435 RepID=D2PN24_KRIFD|nr:GNAT family N-acetyltransferase [Kribbella flavida]ADB34508.1 GCN5-related N-acetyltransferase [Kribbella flavida DSM 17836]
MPTLVEPTTAVHRSFLAAWDELEPADERWMGAHALDEDWTRARTEDPQEFARLVDAIKAEADENTQLPAGLVHQTVLWFTDGDEWLGRLSIRHELTPALLELGGHIGYVVRPSARGHGYGTEMLTQSLPWAARLGIDPALLTCDADNPASRKVIEAAGGELEDERHGKLRFWVPTTLS